MKSVYFHLIGGAAGDMLLSALVGLGCPLSYLKKEFKKLKIDFAIQFKEIKRGHFSDQKIVFSADTNLSYKKIISLIHKSKLDKDIKEKVSETYKTIFAVEKKIHKIKKNDFYFHHLGEIDAILEICGFFLALKYLNIEKVYISPFPLCNPAPATLELLKGKKINVVDLGYETVTPTAAVLLRGYEQIDGPFVFTKSSIACGDFGDRDYLIAYLVNDNPASQLAGLPVSQLASLTGQQTNWPTGKQIIEQDKIIKIETNIDDMNPQIFESVFEALYKRGAKEVYLEQVIMKKNRPAFVLNVLCVPRDFEEIRDIIFSHTTTFGIRYQQYCRDKLGYKFIYKNTKFGKIKFRVSDSRLKKENPEYQDCLAASKKHNIPLREVYRNI